MPKQRITVDDYARQLAEIVKDAKGAAKKAVTQTQAAGEAGTQGGQAFDNPMTAEGSLIVGGETGAPAELPVGAAGSLLIVVDTGGVITPAWLAPGTDGQILKIVSGVPTWVDP